MVKGKPVKNRKSIVDIAKDQGLTPAELGAKGGRAGKGKPKFRLTKGRQCKPNKCQIYPCWAYSMSKAKYNGKCALYHQSDDLSDATLKFLVEGKEGFNQIMTNILSRVYLRATINSTDLKDTLNYVKTIADVSKTIFGEVENTDPELMEEIRRSNDMVESLLFGDSENIDNLEQLKDEFSPKTDNDSEEDN